jgi:hypothetical protein
MVTGDSYESGAGIRPAVLAGMAVGICTTLYTGWGDA